MTSEEVNLPFDENEKGNNEFIVEDEGLSEDEEEDDLPTLPPEEA